MGGYSLAFLILNLGAEMIFVLYARLIAQRVDKDVASTVLNEVVRHMYCNEFMDELFRPQSLYTYAGTRDVFASLVQTSSMRLSPVSMSKLFELMTVVVKYQVFTLRHPFELLELTWTHLEEVLCIIASEGRELLTSVFGRLEQVCAGFKAGDLAEIRKEMLNFFAGRKTSVSVLLDLGLQTQTGSFCLPKDRFLPPLAVCEPPGSIRYYSKENFTASKSFEHRDAVLRHPSFIPLGTWNAQIFSRTDAMRRVTKNGKNMYALDSGNSKGQTVSPQLQRVHSEEARALTGELNHLSELVRGTHSTPQSHFKLSLFDDLDEERGFSSQSPHMDTGNGGSNGRVQPSGSCSTTPANGMSKMSIKVHNKEALRIVNELQLDAGIERQDRSGRDNNLLDIMDED